MNDIGYKIISEIIKQGMLVVNYPDPEVAHVFVWSSGAAEQLEALVAEYASTELTTALAQRDEAQDKLREQAKTMLRIIGEAETAETALAEAQARHNITEGQRQDAETALAAALAECAKTEKILTTLLDEARARSMIAEDRAEKAEADLAVARADSRRLDWKTGTPDIPEGSQLRVLVTTEDANGKRRVHSLLYLNRFIGPCSDDREPPADAEECGDDGEYYWTGWHQESCTNCDTFWSWDGPTVVAWMPFPDSAIAAHVRDELLRRIAP
jgi:hypothetical protein